MARKDDFSSMLANKNDKELERIMEQVQEIRRKRDEETRTEAKKEIEAKCAEIKELASSIGLGFTYTLGAAAPRGRQAATTGRSKVAPKYKNPGNPSQTWSGRGMKPTWLRAELEKGRKIEEFLIG